MLDLVNSVSTSPMLHFFYCEVNFLISSNVSNTVIGNKPFSKSKEGSIGDRIIGREDR